MSGPLGVPRPNPVFYRQRGGPTTPKRPPLPLVFPARPTPSPTTTDLLLDELRHLEQQRRQRTWRHGPQTR